MDEGSLTNFVQAPILLHMRSKLPVLVIFVAKFTNHVRTSVGISDVLLRAEIVSWYNKTLHRWEEMQFSELVAYFPGENRLLINLPRFVSSVLVEEELLSRNLQRFR